MKKLTIQLILSLAFTISFASDSFESFTHRFKNPSSDYRTAPLWVWNDKVTVSEIDKSLIDLKDEGFGGVFVHPRMGLQTEYLSKDWHDMCEYSLKKCKELGLNFWIYDENSYPSGFAGGLVQDAMPESYNQARGLRVRKIKDLPDDTSKYFFILSKDGDKYIDITGNIKKYKGKTGEYYLYEKAYLNKTPWIAGFSYVDLLIPGVTEKFLDVTYTEYKKRLGKEFGKGVKGVFTDEPMIESPKDSFTWTPSLFEDFKKEYGYDLKENLPYLNFKTGEYKKIGRDYHALLLKLFQERWAIPYSNFCKENNLVFTGHYWEHDWPSPSRGPDTMAMIQFHNMPGIDMLFGDFNEETCRQFGNIRSVKEISSIANQLGYERTLSETYGGGGFCMSFERMKLLADWQFLLGINFVNQHLTHTGMTGVRKTDYPPMFNQSASWWGSYKDLNDYLARMSYVGSMGEQHNDILVIEPTTTGWFYKFNWSFRETPPELEKIKSSFRSIVNALQKNFVEYDLGSEDVIKRHGKILEKNFVVGKRSYSVVVIPEDMENIESKTFELLKEFNKNGGRIIALSKPDRLDGSESKEVKKFFDSINITDKKESISELKKYAKIKIKDVKGGNPYHLHRKIDENTGLVMFGNIDENNSTEFSIEIDAKSLANFNPRNGSYEGLKFNSDGKTVNIKMDPVESFVLYYDKLNQDKFKVTKNADMEFKEFRAISDLSVKRVLNNVLVISFMDFKFGDKYFENKYFYDMMKEYFKYLGYSNGSPWLSAIQFKREIVDRKFPDKTGFVATYYFDVENGVELKGMKLMCERPELYTITINGKVLSGWMSSVIDTELKNTDISESVIYGTNKIQMVLEKPNVLAEVWSLQVLGNFGVKEIDKKWKIVEDQKLELGYWKNQGMPFYPWSVLYSKEYDINDLKKEYRIKVSEYEATVLEVLVNGKKVGNIYSKNEEFDLTKFLIKGKNTIGIVAIGGMENFFGPHFTNATKRKSFPPPAWAQSPKSSDTSNYIINDYGLTKDFTVLMSK